MLFYMRHKRFEILNSYLVGAYREMSKHNSIGSEYLCKNKIFTLSIFQENVVLYPLFPLTFNSIFDWHLGQELEKHTMLGGVTYQLKFLSPLEKTQQGIPGRRFLLLQFGANISFSGSIHWDYVENQDYSLTQKWKKSCIYWRQQDLNLIQGQKGVTASYLFHKTQSQNHCPMLDFRPNLHDRCTFR